jgi:4-hydroxy-tetrahydrodipicolinate reductase
MSARASVSAQAFRPAPVFRIGVFGAGRLGSAVAAEAGPALAWQVTRDEPPAERVDAAIEVSAPAAVPQRLAWAIETRTPLVVGTTGWSASDLEARVAGRTGLLVAPNFSLLVWLMKRMAGALARFAAQDPARDLWLAERHHARKLDAPSGTARMLAAELIEHCPRKRSWRIASEGPLAPHELSLAVVRSGSAFSTHEIGIDAPGEELLVAHEARSMLPYARGALTAARWLAEGGRRGVFTMDDLARELFAPLLEGSRESGPRQP